MPMTTADAATGLGFSPQQASLIGANANKRTGAGTSSQTNAAILQSRNTELNPGGASSNGFVPPSNAAVMEPYFLINSQSTTALVYVPSGHTLSSVTNGGSNGFVSVPQNTSCIFWQYKPKFWAALLSATA